MTVRRFVVVCAVAIAILGATAVAPAAGADAQVTVSPTTGLGWRSDVEVRITGATPGALVRIEECFSGDGDADCVLLGTTRVTDAGKARHTVRVRRSVIGTEDGGDCWRAGYECHLSVASTAGG